MKVNMVTGLNALGKWIRFQNAGGMATQVPILAQRLREKGILVDVDGAGSYDVVHLHNPMPTLLPVVIKAKRNKVPVVIHARHIPELVQGGFKFGDMIHPLFNKYSQWLYNQADVVVCATPYVERWMKTNNVKTPTVVIPNGVDTRRFSLNPAARQRFREEHGVEDNCVVFSVGLLIPRKGVRDFIEVAKQLSPHHRFQFIWVGSTEAGLERADISDAPANTHFLGHVPFEGMPQVYAGGDIFLFPTYAESYGNVLFEAAAAGKVLVIRDIEIYQDMVHGVQCLKGSSAADFVAQIQKSADDQALQRCLQNGACHLAQAHNIENTVKKLAELYASLVP